MGPHLTEDFFVDIVKSAILLKEILYTYRTVNLFADWRYIYFFSDAPHLRMLYGLLTIFISPVFLTF